MPCIWLELTLQWAGAPCFAFRRSGSCPAGAELLCAVALAHFVFPPTRPSLLIMAREENIAYQ
eukprot:2677647-Amphidinium_carterae.1